MCAFLSAVASNRCALIPAVRQYFFAGVSLVLVMFWHDFGQEGGGAMVTMFPRGAWYSTALSLIHLINSFTAIRVLAGTKKLDLQHNNQQTSPPWWCRLPLLRRGIVGYARSDASDLFRRGWPRAGSLGLVRIVKITV